MGDGGRLPCICELNRNAGHVVCEGLRVRKGDHRSTDSVYQLLWLELAVHLDQLDQAVFAKALSGLVLGFGYAVRIEEKHVSHLERNGNLPVDCPLAESQGHIVALQRFTRARAPAKVDRLRVSAIDKINPAPLQIEPRVAKGCKAFEADELLGHFGMDERDDLFGCRELPTSGRGNEAAERAQEVALDRSAKKGRGNPFTHDVSNDNVEVLVIILEKVVEVAVDLL